MGKAARIKKERKQTITNETAKNWISSDDVRNWISDVIFVITNNEDSFNQKTNIFKSLRSNLLASIDNEPVEKLATSLSIINESIPFAIGLKNWRLYVFAGVCIALYPINIHGEELTAWDTKKFREDMGIEDDETFLDIPKLVKWKALKQYALMLKNKTEEDE
jgi:hypothetical protein